MNRFGKLISNEFRRLISDSRFMLLVYSPFVLILLALVIAELYFNIPMSILTRDPAAIADLPFYTGWISSLGAVLWAASASIALYASRICKGECRRYLTFMGLFLSVLLIDDFFMMHDGLLPLIGVSEKFLFLAYAIIIILIIKYNAKFLMKQNYWMLLSAAFFLAVSVAVDVKLGKYLPLSYLFEDGAKFLGIVGIFGHIIDVTSKLIPRSKN